MWPDVSVNHWILSYHWIRPIVATMLRHKYMPKANTAIKPGRERTATELGCGSTLYIYIDTISLFTQTLNGMSNKSRKLVLLFTFSRAFSYYFICYTQCTRHIVKLHETYYGKLKKRRKKILILAASLLTTTSGGGMFVKIVRKAK